VTEERRNEFATSHDIQTPFPNLSAQKTASARLRLTIAVKSLFNLILTPGPEDEFVETATPAWNHLSTIDKRGIAESFLERLRSGFPR
jgi:hypothetical protein